MDDLIAEFLTETNESLEELDNDLVNLEQNPNDANLLGKIFRLMHTIKGTCGFLDLPRLEKVAHHAENIMGRFRDGDLKVTPAYVTLIFESLDQIKFIVAQIEETGSEPEGNDAELIEKLDAVYEGRDTDGAATATDLAPAEPEPTPQTEEKEDPPIIVKDREGGASDNDALLAAFGDPVPAALTGQNEEFTSAQAEETDAAATEDTAHDDETETDNGVADEPALAVVAETPEKNAPAAKEAKKVVTTQSLRVNVDVLEDLMTMVSELVLTRNQLLQILRAQKETDFTAPLQRLNHVVSDLQEGVMKTRMQPIGNAWSKLPRIIRDLALELDKKLELEMRGQETELDRQVLELIKDPLTHMVRNSGDHGIETPDERVKAGKPETGRILLNAYHEGGHIIIQISDDGKGLSTEKIKAKAAMNGLATAEELEDMSKKQIQQFIFKAGFSTAEQVTAVSGRGVGMDVVRTNIEKIGGSIELDSEEGKGSTFTIKIPLTLAIVSALIVESGGERFAIPQLSVRELVMTSSTSDNQIEMIKGSPVYRLRDHLLPLVSLTDLLELKSPQGSVRDELNDLKAQIEAMKDDNHKEEVIQANAADTNAAQNTEHNAALSKEDNQYIVVTQVGVYDFGIIVDRVFDTEEIVVKPVAKILRDLDLFSGNTILGDGSVIMILDPNGIARRTGEVETDSQRNAESVQEQLASSQERTSLLLFRAGDRAPKAVPLSLVARLENIDMGSIEYSGEQMLVQYRGTLMPLLPFNHSVQIEGAKEKPTLVFSYQENSMGIVVDDIVDITEQVIDIQIEGVKEGIMGSAIINDKATDVIDVGYFLRSVNKNWFKDHDDTPYDQSVESRSKKRRLLLVDDSPFFRNMLTPLLSTAGYEVTTLQSPQEALDLCDKGAAFDIIVSDIEMPDMNGFEFAEKIKADSKWQDTPLVALSSHATPQDIDRGLEVGFNKYIAKFDRETLLHTISETLAERAEG